MSWEVKPLGELCSIQNGFAFKSKLFGDDGMPLIRIRDLSNGFETQTRYSGEYDENFVVMAGDVLVGMDGEFRCYEWKGEPALLNQRVCRLEGFDHRLSQRYTYYGINKYLKAIEDVTSFTTVKHLSAKKIKAIQFPIPPLEEQERIVEILDEAFAAIDKAKANIERNLTNARELFQSRLNDIFSNPSEDWEVKPLGEVCVVKDGTHDSPKYVTNGIPFVTQKNITKNGVSFENTKFITISDHEQFSKRSNVGKGDILISMIGANRGESCIVSSEREFSIKNVGLIKNGGEIDTLFISVFLKSPLAQKYVIENSSGSAQGFISLGTLRRWPIPVPSVAGCDRIVMHCSELEKWSNELFGKYQTELDNLEELRQSILEQAFEGKLTEPVVA